MKYCIVGVGDYFNKGGPGIRQRANSIEELPFFKALLEDNVPRDEWMDIFDECSGDGQENWVLIKGAEVELIEEF